MLKYLFNLELKKQYRSVIYSIYILFSLMYAAFIIYLSNDIATVNTFYAIYASHFFEYIIFSVVFLVSVASGIKKCTIADICFTDKSKVFFAKYFTCFLSELIACIPVIIFMVIGISQNGLSATYFLMGLFEHTARIIILILTAHTLGFVTGYVTRNIFSVLLVLPATCIFTSINVYIFPILSLSDTPGDLLPNLLTVNPFFQETHSLVYSGPAYDLMYLARDMFKIFFCAALIFITCTVINKYKKFCYAVISIACVSLCVFSIYLFTDNFPKTYDYNTEAVLSPESENATDDYISECSGQIKLVANGKFSVNITAHDKNSDGFISFNLDDCFEITELSIEDKPPKYERNGKQINIKINEETANINIAYEGHPYYRTDYYPADIYTSTHSSALPAGFAFLPLTGSSEKTTYKLTVEAKNTVISNLDCDYKEGFYADTAKINEYEFIGESNTVALFCGYFDTFEKNGLTVYHARYDSLYDYEECVDMALSFRKRNYAGLGNDQVVDLTDEDINGRRKLFLIYYSYGSGTFPCYFDDSVYFNMGDSGRS